MKKYFHFLLVLIIQYNSFGQSFKKIDVSQFNWIINIPGDYIEVEPEVWEDQQQNGEEFIEKAIGEDLINQAITLFVYQKDNFNSIESNYQPFDEAIDGDYLEVFDGVNDILYETFSQIQGIKIKKKRGTKMIDNLLFQSFEMKITYPNKMILYCLIFSKLINKEELTINIIYVDEKEGELLKKALFNSTFGK